MIRQLNLESALLLGVGWGLAATLGTATLPWGATLPFDRFVLASILLFFATVVLLTSSWRETSLRILAPGGALGVIATLGFLQALPLPEFLVRLFAGLSAGVWDSARALSGEEAGPMTLSMAPEQSLDSASWFGVLAVTYLIAAVVGRETERRRILAGALVVTGLLQIVLPIAPGLAERHRLFAGLGPSPNLGTHWFRGTYANPNHLSLLLGMVLLVMAASLWWGVRRALRGDSLTRRVFAVTGPLVLLLAFSTALARIGSRAGLLAVGCGFLTVSGAIAAHYGRRRLLAALAILSATGVGFGSIWLMFFGGREGLADIFRTSVYDLTVLGRLRVVVESLGLWLQAPLVGTGIGAYRQTFPLAQSTALSDTWEHVHNDWVEILVTGGPVAFAALLAGLVLLVMRLWLVFHRGRRSEDRAAGLAALGALTVAGIHEVFDFGLLVPANALVLVVICGAAAGAPVALGQRRRRRRPRSTPELVDEGPKIGNEPDPPRFGAPRTKAREAKEHDMETVRKSVARGIVADRRL